MIPFAAFGFSPAAGSFQGGWVSGMGPGVPALADHALRRVLRIIT